VEKLENKVSIGDFEKLQHIPDKEVCEHMQSCLHAQERSERALISSLAILKVLCKQDVQAKAEF